MKALGVNTYLGGFQVGLSRVFEDLGSAESWSPAVNHRWMPTLTFEEAARVKPDVVYANPPCSRFSNMSAAFYTDQDRRTCFPDLQDALTLAGKAQCFWWETGPMAWRYGRELIEEVGREFRTTVVVRLCVSWFGVPQLRPRTHVLHFRDELEPPPLRRVPLYERALDWLGDEDGTPLRRWDPDEMMAMRASSFRSTQPKIVWAGDALSPAVLSGRHLCREGHRWFWAEEYGALMGLPRERVTSLASEVSRGDVALALMSKGVCADAGSYLARELVLRMQPGEGGTFWIDASRPDHRLLPPKTSKMIEYRHAPG